jgi:hypothetical protein
MRPLGRWLAPTILVLTLSAGAAADAPHGTYVLDVCNTGSCGRSAVHRNNKPMPSCGEAAQARLAKLGAMVVEYSSSGVTVNEAVWVIRQTTNGRVLVRNPDDEDLELWFYRHKERAGGLMLLWGSTENAGACVDRRFFAGPYRTSSSKA